MSPTTAMNGTEARAQIENTSPLAAVAASLATHVHVPAADAAGQLWELACKLAATDPALRDRLGAIRTALGSHGAGPVVRAQLPLAEPAKQPRISPAFYLEVLSKARASANGLHRASAAAATVRAEADAVRAGAEGMAVLVASCGFGLAESTSRVLQTPLYQGAPVAAPPVAADFVPGAEFSGTGRNGGVRVTGGFMFFVRVRRDQPSLMPGQPVSKLQSYAAGLKLSSVMALQTQTAPQLPDLLQRYTSDGIAALQSGNGKVSPANSASSTRSYSQRFHAGVFSDAQDLSRPWPSQAVGGGIKHYKMIEVREATDLLAVQAVTWEVGCALSIAAAYGEPAPDLSAIPGLASLDAHLHHNEQNAVASASSSSTTSRGGHGGFGAHHPLAGAVDLDAVGLSKRKRRRSNSAAGENDHPADAANAAVSPAATAASSSTASVPSSSAATDPLLGLQSDEAFALISSICSHLCPGDVIFSIDGYRPTGVDNAKDLLFKPKAPAPHVPVPIPSVLIAPQQHVGAGSSAAAALESPRGADASAHGAAPAASPPASEDPAAASAASNAGSAVNNGATTAPPESGRPRRLASLRNDTGFGSGSAAAGAGSTVSAEGARTRGVGARGSKGAATTSTGGAGATASASPVSLEDEDVAILCIFRPAPRLDGMLLSVSPRPNTSSVGADSSIPPISSTGDAATGPAGPISYPAVDLAALRQTASVPWQQHLSSLQTRAAAAERLSRSISSQHRGLQFLARALKPFVQRGPVRVVQQGLPLLADSTADRRSKSVVAARTIEAGTNSGNSSSNDPWRKILAVLEPSAAGPSDVRGTRTSSRRVGNHSDTPAAAGRFDALSSAAQAHAKALRSLISHVALALDSAADAIVGALKRPLPALADSNASSRKQAASNSQDDGGEGDDHDHDADGDEAEDYDSDAQMSTDRDGADAGSAAGDAGVAGNASADGAGASASHHKRVPRRRKGGKRWSRPKKHGLHLTAGLAGQNSADAAAAAEAERIAEEQEQEEEDRDSAREVLSMLIRGAGQRGFNDHSGAAAQNDADGDVIILDDSEAGGSSNNTAMLATADLSSNQEPAAAADKPVVSIATYLRLREHHGPLSIAAVPLAPTTADKPVAAASASTAASAQAHEPTPVYGTYASRVAGGAVGRGYANAAAGSSSTTLAAAQRLADSLHTISTTANADAGVAGSAALNAPLSGSGAVMRVGAGGEMVLRQKNADAVVPSSQVGYGRGEVPERPSYGITTLTACDGPRWSTSTSGHGSASHVAYGRSGGLVGLASLFTQSEGMMALLGAVMRPEVLPQLAPESDALQGSFSASASSDVSAIVVDASDADAELEKLKTGLILRALTDAATSLAHVGDPSSLFAPSNLPPQWLYGRIRRLTTVKGHSEAVWCVSADPSGRMVVTGADDGLIKLWSGKTAGLQATFRATTECIAHTAVSPCGGHVAAATTDKTNIIRVWSLADASPTAVLHGHTGEINSLAWDSAFGLLVSVGDDGTLRLWDVHGRYMDDKTALQPVGSAGSPPEASNGAGGAASHDAANPDDDIPAALQPLARRQNRQRREIAALTTWQNGPSGAGAQGGHSRRGGSSSSATAPASAAVVDELSRLQRMLLPSDITDASKRCSIADHAETPLESERLWLARAEARHHAAYAHSSSANGGGAGAGAGAARSAPATAAASAPLEDPRVSDPTAPCKVLSLSVCPTGGYVATGDDKGVLRIWQTMEPRKPAEYAHRGHAAATSAQQHAAMTGADGNGAANSKGGSGTQDGMDYSDDDELAGQMVDVDGEAQFSASQADADVDVVNSPADNVSAASVVGEPAAAAPGPADADGSAKVETTLQVPAIAESTADAELLDPEIVIVDVGLDQPVADPAVAFLQSHQRDSPSSSAHLPSIPEAFTLRHRPILCHESTAHAGGEVNEIRFASTGTALVTASHDTGHVNLWKWPRHATSLYTSPAAPASPGHDDGVSGSTSSAAQTGGRGRRVSIAPGSKPSKKDRAASPPRSFASAVFESLDITFVADKSCPYTDKSTPASARNGGAFNGNGLVHAQRSEAFARLAQAVKSGAPMKPADKARPTNYPLKVTSVCWSCDDSMIAIAVVRKIPSDQVTGQPQPAYNTSATDPSYWSEPGERPAPIQHGLFAGTTPASGAGGGAAGSGATRSVRERLVPSSASHMSDAEQKQCYLRDPHIQIWDAASGTPLRTIRAHAGEISIISPHPTDPRIMLSIGCDGRTVVNDVSTGIVLASFLTFRPALRDDLQAAGLQWQSEALAFVIASAAGANATGGRVLGGSSTHISAAAAAVASVGGADDGSGSSSLPFTSVEFPTPNARAQPYLTVDHAMLRDCAWITESAGSPATSGAAGVGAARAVGSHTFSFVVTDDWGQLHYFGCGPDSRAKALGDAKYAQWLSFDMSPFHHDIRGHIIDTQTQREPHVLLPNQPLCDSMGRAYPAAEQQPRMQPGTVPEPLPVLLQDVRAWALLSAGALQTAALPADIHHLNENVLVSRKQASARTQISEQYEAFIEQHQQLQQQQMQLQNGGVSAFESAATTVGFGARAGHGGRDNGVSSVTSSPARPAPVNHRSTVAGLGASHRGASGLRTSSVAGGANSRMAGFKHSSGTSAAGAGTLDSDDELALAAFGGRPVRGSRGRDAEPEAPSTEAARGRPRSRGTTWGPGRRLGGEEASDSENDDGDVVAIGDTAGNAGGGAGTGHDDDIPTKSLLRDVFAELHLPPPPLVPASSAASAGSDATATITTSAIVAASGVAQAGVLQPGEFSFSLEDGTRIPAKRCAFCRRGEEERPRLPTAGGASGSSDGAGAGAGSSAASSSAATGGVDESAWDAFDPLQGIEGRFMRMPIYLATASGTINAAHGPATRLAWVHTNCAAFAPQCRSREERDDWPELVRSGDGKIIGGGIEGNSDPAHAHVPAKEGDQVENDGLMILMKHPTFSTANEVQILGSAGGFASYSEPARIDTEFVWYNIGVEVNRARQLRCSECKETGAAIGCSYGSCGKTYHFRCAVKNGWQGWRGGINAAIPHGADFGALSTSGRAIDAKLRACAAFEAERLSRRKKGAHVAPVQVAPIPDQFQPLYCERHSGFTQAVTGLINRAFSHDTRAPSPPRRDSRRDGALSIRDAGTAVASSAAPGAAGAPSSAGIVARPRRAATSSAVYTDAASDSGMLEDFPEGVFDDSDDEYMAGAVGRRGRLRRAGADTRVSSRNAHLYAEPEAETREARARRRDAERVAEEYAELEPDAMLDPKEAAKLKAKAQKREMDWRASVRLERSWLQRTRPTPLLYVPQVGDEVVYIPQGHEEYLQKLQAEGKGGDSRPEDAPFRQPKPWPPAWAAVLARVEEISYSFPSKDECDAMEVQQAQLTFASVAPGAIGDDGAAVAPPKPKSSGSKKKSGAAAPSVGAEPAADALPTLPNPSQLDGRSGYYVIATLKLTFIMTHAHKQSAFDKFGNVIWDEPRPSRSNPKPDSFSLRYHPGLTAENPDFLLLRSRYEASMRRFSSAEYWGGKLCRVAVRWAESGWEEGLAYSDTPLELLPPALTQCMEPWEEKMKGILKAEAGTSSSSSSKSSGGGSSKKPKLKFVMSSTAAAVAPAAASAASADDVIVAAADEEETSGITEISTVATKRYSAAVQSMTALAQQQSNATNLLRSSAASTAISTPALPVPPTPAASSTATIAAAPSYRKLKVHFKLDNARVHAPEGHSSAGADGMLVAEMVPEDVEDTDLRVADAPSADSSAVAAVVPAAAPSAVAAKVPTGAAPPAKSPRAAKSTPASSEPASLMTSGDIWSGDYGYGVWSVPMVNAPPIASSTSTSTDTAASSSAAMSAPPVPSSIASVAGADIDSVTDFAAAMALNAGYVAAPAGGSAAIPANGSSGLTSTAAVAGVSSDAMIGLDDLHDKTAGPGAVAASRAKRARTSAGSAIAPAPVPAPSAAVAARPGTAGATGSGDASAPAPRMAMFDGLVSPPFATVAYGRAYASGHHKWYLGRVINVEASDARKYPESPWESVHVIWKEIEADPEEAARVQSPPPTSSSSPAALGHATSRKPTASRFHLGVPGLTRRQYAKAVAQLESLADLQIAEFEPQKFCPWEVEMDGLTFMPQSLPDPLSAPSVVTDATAGAASATETAASSTVTSPPAAAAPAPQTFLSPRRGSRSSGKAGASAVSAASSAGTPFSVSSAEAPPSPAAAATAVALTTPSAVAAAAPTVGEAEVSLGPGGRPRRAAAAEAADVVAAAVKPTDEDAADDEMAGAGHGRRSRSSKGGVGAAAGSKRRVSELYPEGEADGAVEPSGAAVAATDGQTSAPTAGDASAVDDDAEAPTAYDHPWLSIAIATRFDRIPGISPEVSKALIDGLRGLVAAEHRSPFVDDFLEPVDCVSVAVGYDLHVPVPMDLTTIMVRLLTGYYRQIESVRADVDLILHNCKLFNAADSDIVESAQQLHQELQQILENAAAGAHVQAL